MLVTTMVVLARVESSDISLGDIMVLLGELVALLLAILTGVMWGVLVATLDLIKSVLNLSNSCCIFSLKALIRGEKMLVRSACMVVLDAMGMLVILSGGSIIETPERSQIPSG